MTLICNSISLLIHVSPDQSQEYVYVLRALYDKSGYYYSQYQVDTASNLQDSVVVVVRDSEGYPTSAVIVFIGEGDSKDTINIGESGRLILSKEQRDRYLAFVCERGIERIRGYWFDLVEYDDETWEKIPYCHEVLTIVLPNTDVHTHYRIRSHSPLNHEEIESVRRDLLEGVNVTKKYKNLVIEKAYML